MFLLCTVTINDHSVFDFDAGRHSRTDGGTYGERWDPWATGPQANAAYIQAHRRLIINGHVDKAVTSDLYEVMMHVKLQRDRSGLDTSCKRSMAD